MIAMPVIPIKTKEEILLMREACRIATLVLEGMKKAAVPGINTYDLDQCGRRLMEEHGAESACYNYQLGSLRFPAYTCISINEEIVHGIGRLQRVLQVGDIVSIDVVVRYRGYIGDNAYTVALEPVDKKVHQLIETTKEALFLGIKEARAGRFVGDISHAIQKHVEKAKLSVVEEFVGHGVGKAMHEPPPIPNFGQRRQGPMLRAGMVLAIEPMVNLGTHHFDMAADGWTAITKDRKPSAHFEHTVLVREGEPEILTNWKN